MKWRMGHTKKTGEMTTAAAMEIAEKIISHFQLTIRIIFQYFVNAMYNCVFSVQDSFEEQATHGSFIPMDVRMFSLPLLDVQSTLDVSVLLESVSPSSTTLVRLHGRPVALSPCLLKNCSN